MKKKSTGIVTLLPQQKTLGFTNETSLLELFKVHKIPINHSCGGMGSCTTCRVIIESDLVMLPKRNQVEQEMADMRGFHPKERLSCQTPPIDGMILRIALRPIIEQK